MMTISESNYSSNKMSTVRTLNDRVVHSDSCSDSQHSEKTSNSALVTKRGFKPSDMFDPLKKEFLTNLSYKLFPEEFSDNKSPITVGDKEIDLNKIFTPAPDADDYIIKKNRQSSFASSSFYASGFHPTVKEQMDLARKISSSLSEPANKLSKGQSMYVNRKKRADKWVHEGKGKNTSTVCTTATPVSTHDTPYRPPMSKQQQSQAQNKYSTLPTKFNSPAPKLQPINVLPKMEPFPTSCAALAPLSPLPCAPASLPPSRAGCQPSCRNYNTAARPWGEQTHVYRPVTFDNTGASNALPYSDF